MIISRGILIIMIHFSDRHRKNETTFYDQRMFSENFAVYELIWKYMVESDRPQMTVQHGACVLHAV